MQFLHQSNLSLLQKSKICVSNENLTIVKFRLNVQYMPYLRYY